MESDLYGIYALVVFVSEILLVRFLIRQQLVHKYRTPALSMKYSLFPFHVLLSFPVCINTESKAQTGATFFKTALKVELFSCFDGWPITRARKRCLPLK